FCDEAFRARWDSTRTSTERDYELEKILYRLLRRIRFHLRLWIHLVRRAHARRAPGSLNAFSTQAQFPMATLGTYRDGVLFYAALCEVRTRGWRGDMCAIGPLRCAGLRGRSSDHVRRATDYE